MPTHPTITHYSASKYLDLSVFLPNSDHDKLKKLGEFSTDIILYEALCKIMTENACKYRKTGEQLGGTAINFEILFATSLTCKNSLLGT